MAVPGLVAMRAGWSRHVLLVHDAYDDYVTCLANTLGERVHLTVLHNSRVHDRIRRGLSGSQQTIVYPHRRVRDPRRIGEIPHIDRVAATVGADVVHVQQSNDPLFNLVQLCSRRSHGTRVLTVHDITPHPGDAAHVPGGHLTLRAQSRRWDRVVVHADVLRSDLARAWNVPHARVDVVPHGELGSLYRPADSVGTDTARPAATLRVLFFGRVWPYKGLDRLISAMNRLATARPTLTLTICGTGEPLDRYLQLVEPQLTIEVVDRFVEHEEVAPLFASATVVCLPYLEASQSGVQALACGLGVPVVATDVGGLASAVADGQSGLVVPPDDVGALTTALGRVLDDPTLRDRLAKGSRTRSATDLSWEAIADQTLEVYRRARAGHGAFI